MKKIAMFSQLVVVVLMVLACTSSYAAKRVVMVSLFENLSKTKDIIRFEGETTSALDYRSKTFSVDRYSEIPRSLLEDVIINLGSDVIERQSLHKMLTEHKFITDSGLADTTTAIKIGKMLGADTLVVGTITDIKKKRKKFKGYGISTNFMMVDTSIRVRVIDIESGRIVFSKKAKGSARVDASEEKAPIAESIEDAVETISEEQRFISFFQN